jgi:hypothetical protein
MKRNNLQKERNTILSTVGYVGLGKVKLGKVRLGKV